MRAWHVLASGAADRLVQVFGGFNTGPLKVLASVWVYVVHGQVGSVPGRRRYEHQRQEHSTRREQCR